MYLILSIKGDVLVLVNDKLTYRKRLSVICSLKIGKIGTYR